MPKALVRSDSLEWERVLLSKLPVCIRAIDFLSTVYYFFSPCIGCCQENQLQSSFVEEKEGKRVENYMQEGKTNLMTIRIPKTKQESGRNYQRMSVQQNVIKDTQNCSFL